MVLVGRRLAAPSRAHHRSIGAGRKRSPLRGRSQGHVRCAHFAPACRVPRSDGSDDSRQKRPKTNRSLSSRLELIPTFEIHHTRHYTVSKSIFFTASSAQSRSRPLAGRDFVTTGELNPLTTRPTSRPAPRTDGWLPSHGRLAALPPRGRAAPTPWAPSAEREAEIRPADGAGGGGGRAASRPCEGSEPSVRRAGLLVGRVVKGFIPASGRDRDLCS